MHKYICNARRAEIGKIIHLSGSFELGQMQVKKVEEQSQVDKAAPKQLKEWKNQDVVGIYQTGEDFEMSMTPNG